MIAQSPILQKSKTLNKTFVLSGELIISKKNEIIWTVLGSCVTVIFYIASKKTTFFSHAQLPMQEFSKNACTKNCPKPCYNVADDSNEYKFVSCTLRAMIAKLKKMNITKNQVKIYLLGGSTSFNIKFNDGKSIGERNIETAQNILKELKIPVKQHIGGKGSRKVCFNTETGLLEIKQS